MRASLSHDHARQILLNFADGHRPRVLRSNNSFMGEKAIGHYVYPVLNVDLLPAKDLFAKAELSRSIRHKFTKKQQVLPLNLPLTASEAFLRAHLEGRYVEGDFRQNLRTLLASKSDYFMSRKGELEASLPFLEDILHQETLYPNHFCAVHGSEGHFGLLWLLGHVIQSELFLQDVESVRTLRLFDSAFEGVETLDAHFQNMDHRRGYLDYEPGGQARIISVNFSPLLSLGRESSETLSLFFRGDSVHPIDAPRAILVKFLESLKLPSMAVDHFMGEMDPIFKSLEKCGALWQLFFPTAVGEHYVYLSHPGGKPIAFNGQDEKGSPRNSPVAYLTAARTNPDQISELLRMGDHFNLIQGRVLLHPEMLYGESSQGVHSNIFFSDGRDVSRLQEAVQSRVKRILSPHLYLANSSSAYSRPPRLVQLHNSITGATKDEVSPQLAHLMAVSEKEGKSSPAVLTLLEDPSIAKLETVDPLSLKRVRALELSSITSALTDRLLQFHVSSSPEAWTDRIRMLRAKFAELAAYSKIKMLHALGDESLAHLLTIDWENPGCHTVQQFTSDPNICKIAAGFTPWDRGKTGEALVIIHLWSQWMPDLLPYLESVGMINYDSFTVGECGSSAILDAIVALKDVPPPRIWRVMTSLAKEKELKIKYSHEIDAGQFLEVSQSPLIVRVAKGKIREIKRSLRHIFKTLNITAQDPVDFGTADRLLDGLEKLGTKWESVAETFCRHIKNNIFMYDVGGTMDFILKNEDKVEPLMRQLTAMNFLNSGRKIPYLSSLLHFLSEHPESLNIMTYLHSERLYNGELIANTLYPILKMPQDQQISIAELVRQCADDIPDPKNVKPVIENLMMCVDIEPSRVKDLLHLMGPLSQVGNPWELRDYVVWAFSLSPDLYQHVPFFFSLGLSHKHSQYLPDIIANRPFIEDHRRELSQLLKENADNTLTLLRDQKLTGPVLTALSSLDGESKRNLLSSRPLLDLVLAATKYEPSILKSIAFEHFPCRYLCGVSDQLIAELPRTLTLIPLLAKYHGLHRIHGNFINHLIQLRDTNLVARLLGDYIDVHLRSDPSSELRSHTSSLLCIIQQIDQEPDSDEKERQIALFPQFLSMNPVTAISGRDLLRTWNSVYLKGS